MCWLNILLCLLTFVQGHSFKGLLSEWTPKAGFLTCCILFCILSCSLHYALSTYTYISVQIIIILSYMYLTGFVSYLVIFVIGGKYKWISHIFIPSTHLIIVRVWLRLFLHSSVIYKLLYYSLVVHTMWMSHECVVICIPILGRHVTVAKQLDTLHM